MTPRIAIGPILAVALLCFLPGPPAVAGYGGGSPDEAVQTVGAADYAVPLEGAMLLSGRITVAADGRVSGYAIDRADQVQPEARDFLARQIGGWRVEWDAGAAPAGKAVRFTAQLRASPLGDGRYRLWLDGVRLDDMLPAGQRIRATRMRPPEYPRSLLRAGGGGVVYMLVRIGRDGGVEDVFAEQVDLTAVPRDPAELPRHQAELFAAAAATVRRWRFALPREGPYAQVPQVMRIPIDFVVREQATPYGQWRYLVRGVRRTPSWVGVVDAGAGLQPARSRLRVVADAGADG